jgi:hypothetical protein
LEEGTASYIISPSAALAPGSNCRKIHLDIFGLEADLADVNTSLRRVLIFNAVFIPILALALGVTAYFVQLEFRQLAEQQVLENAHLMMETAKASRVYTTEQIEPLLTREEARVAQGVKDLNDLLNTQLPQGITTGGFRASKPQGATISPGPFGTNRSECQATASHRPGTAICRSIDSVLRRYGGLQLFPETVPRLFL